MDSPSTFYEAIEIIQQQKSLIKSYETRLQSTDAELKSRRAWAVTLDKHATEIIQDKEAEIEELKEKLNALNTQITDFKAAALNSADVVMHNLEAWGLASIVSNMTGNQDAIDIDKKYLKECLWRFLQVSGGRWPSSNEYYMNMNLLENATDDTLKEYLSMNLGAAIDSQQLRKEAHELFLNSYCLPPWFGAAKN